MTEREALKLALEALEGMATWVEMRPKTHPWDTWSRVEPAIAAIKETLAKPSVSVEQEPVAYWDDEETFVLPKQKEWDKRTGGISTFGCDTPLYTTPPQRKPLTDEQVKTRTDEQIEKIYRAVDGNEFPIDFCREIEFAHGIKGE